MFDMVYTKKIDREAMVENARALLESGGPTAVSMRRLAEMIGVRVSSLYNHFADKADLMRAVAGEGLVELAAVLTRARTQAGEASQGQILAMAQDYRLWGLEHPQLYQMLFVARPLASQPDPLEMNVAAPMIATVAEIVGPENAIAATQAAWSFVHGFVMLELAGQMRRGIPVEGFMLGLEALVRGLPVATMETSG